MMGKRVISAAESSWDQSIISRSAMDELFDNVGLPLKVPSRERAQLVLAKETTWFVWSMFDQFPGKKDVDLWKAQFTSFHEAAEKWAYPPSRPALRKIAEWIDHESMRQIARGAPHKVFDLIALPWLIAFFTECFEPEKSNEFDLGKCVKFIIDCQVELRRSLELVKVPDPQHQGRELFKDRLAPNMRGADAHRKAVQRHMAQANQYRDLIRVNLLQATG